MISTLLRTLELDSGSIFIDSVDLSTVPKEVIRRKLIVIPQKGCLIRGSSLRDHVDPWQGSSDSQILHALNEVGLEFLANKDAEKLNVILNEASLSHGQRQLISLARAILQKGTILILDEATSSIDSITDTAIQKIIREHFKTHTIIAVAHRLETVLDFDKIMYLENGRIVEFDSPGKLLSRPSAFRESYRILRGETVD